MSKALEQATELRAFAASVEAYNTEFANVTALALRLAAHIRLTVLGGPRAPRVLRFTYTNYQGETAVRTVVPEAVRFGTTIHHPHGQWLLDGEDIKRGAPRTFAISDIHELHTPLETP